jgi:hypothetical protein
MIDTILARPVRRLYDEDPHFIGSLRLYGMTLDIEFWLDRNQPRMRFTPQGIGKHSRWYDDVHGDVFTANVEGSELFTTWQFGSDLWDINLRPRTIDALAGEAADAKHWTIFDMRLIKRTGRLQ